MAVPIYPNLAADLNPTGIGQMWLADITYIRLETDFVYLAGALHRLLKQQGIQIRMVPTKECGRVPPLARAVRVRSGTHRYQVLEVMSRGGD
jgi:hypothetical protein